MGFEPQTFRPTVRRANHCAMGAGNPYYFMISYTSSLFCSTTSSCRRLEGHWFTQVAYVCFVLCCIETAFVDCLEKKSWYIWENFWNVNCLWQFDFPEVTQCNWQDVKIHLLTWVAQSNHITMAVTCMNVLAAGVWRAIGSPG